MLHRYFLSFGSKGKLLKQYVTKEAIMWDTSVLEVVLLNFSGFFAMCLTFNKTCQVIWESVKKSSVTTYVFNLFYLIRQNLKTADLTVCSSQNIQKTQPMFQRWISVSDTHLWSCKYSSDVLKVLTISFQKLPVKSNCSTAKEQAVN